MPQMKQVEKKHRFDLLMISSSGLKPIHKKKNRNNKKKGKKMIRKLLLSLLSLAVLGLAIFAWQCHLKQDQLQKAKEERETYESLNYYTGTFTIDDYSFLENGTGVVVHWKSENPEEDALVRKYATLKNADRPVQVTIGARNANYIVRENMKLPSGPNYLDKKNEDDYYTLSIYHVKNQQLEGYKEDLYKCQHPENSRHDEAHPASLLASPSPFQYPSLDKIADGRH